MAADLSINAVCRASCIRYLKGFRDTPGIILSSYPVSRKYDRKQVSLLHEIARVIQENDVERPFREDNAPQEWRQIFSHIFGENESVGLLYYDPLAAYNDIIRKEDELREAIKRGKNFRKELLHLSKVRKNLEKTQLINAFKSHYDELKRLNRVGVYSYFFSPKIVLEQDNPTGTYLAEGKELIERYVVDPFEVRILSSSLNPCEPIYEARPLIEKNLSNIYREIADVIRSPSEELYETKDECCLRDLIDLRREAALSVLEKKFPEVIEHANCLTKLSAFESLRMLKVMPFLLDDDVEEFFLDNPCGAIYLDHRRFGRCVTGVRLSAQEICAIKTRLRSESGMRLDSTNPSLKTEIITRDFQTRFSVDTDPLAYDKFYLDVRKLRKRYYTIPELIMNETLTLDLAAYLYYCLLRRRNITVVGEPSAGKTTLINALDLLTPPEWRKISIEDVIESIPQQCFGRHQVRLNVEPFESFKAVKRSKSTEIVKLLHRSPDWIYLGEIQTAEHSKAMFHALSAGLKGFQTCHASSVEQAIMRWIIHHNISPICMFDLDIMIHIKKLYLNGRLARKVIKVCEVIPIKCIENSRLIRTSISTIELKDIFVWNPKTSLLEVKSNLFETPVMQKIRELDYIHEDEFWSEINAYKSIFNELAVKHVFSPKEVVEIFDYIHSEKTMKKRLGEINWQLLVNNIFKRINEQWRPDRTGCISL